MSAIMAVDVGSVRIGLAICEAPGVPAMPLETIAHTSRDRDIQAILQRARERDATVIVVGYPLRLDGSAGPAAKRIDAFVAALRAVFAGTVVVQDERLTTAAAGRKLRDLDLPGSKKRRLVDQLAAVEILNGYLAVKDRS